MYVGIGDNGNSANAQNLDTYHGKVIRINSDGTVPPGNPYSTGSAQRQRVWSYGLRNPYTLDFNPVNGRLFINDVGQGSWEEINEGTTSNLNFGWPGAEGNSSNPLYTNPVYTYGHGTGTFRMCNYRWRFFLALHLLIIPHNIRVSIFLLTIVVNG
ncbi:MAG: PQQ-dependent sugar dehydrogenase [Bacteroidetes bacterium]|nr:PQQ-dependent sugar dehydrogenase [Bacteroidota bacterium]